MHYVTIVFQNNQIQIVVLLERLLERDTFATATLTQLDNCYRFAEKNAEVCCVWFIVVVLCYEQ